jgi:hypothetical protein
MKTDFILPMEYRPLDGEGKQLPDYYLATGEHLGIKFYVLNLKGIHPCAYLRVPKGKTLHGLGYDEASEYLPGVHGGLTYAENNLAYVTNDDESWFLGWDYGHCWDYAGYFMRDENSYVESHMKKWTTNEIVNECKDVCESVHNLWKANGEVD